MFLQNIKLITLPLVTLLRVFLLLVSNTSRIFYRLGKSGTPKKLGNDSPSALDFYPRPASRMAKFEPYKTKKSMIHCFSISSPSLSIQKSIAIN